MYLNKKQVAALGIAIDAIDGFRSGLKTDEEQEAFNTILEMLDSSRAEKQKRYYRRQHRRGKNAIQKA